MDTKLRNKNPKSDANFLSKLFFIWIIKLFSKISKTQTIQISDLFKILPTDNSQQLADKFEQKWQQELTKKQPKLLNAIIQTFLKEYLLFGCILFIQHVFLRTAQPIILAFFLQLFHQENANNLYLTATILTIVTFLIVITMHHATYGQAAIGMRIRIALSSLIYRKTLKLNQKSLHETSTGQIINLLSNDLSRFDLVVLTLNYMWILPFQISLVTFLCWMQIGFSGLIGITTIALLSLPIQGYLGKLTSFFRSKVAEKCDQRVTVMSEIINGIQAIKMYGWEEAFQQFITRTRSQELKYLTTASYLRGIYLSFIIFVDRTALFLTLSCYVLIGNQFGPDQVFSLSQFYNLLQLTMSVFYPLSITYGAETLVAIERIEQFLKLDEKEDFSIEQNSEVGLEMQNIQFNNLLLNFQIPKGSFCAIIGPIGSGKSTILQLILNELTPASGSIKTPEMISFSSQQSWLFSATIRENILFGNQYDKKLYRKVLRICALEKDLEQFVNKDKTLIGDRGATLSGGQKARINLARAIYREADLYLFDDPLSAVDNNVASHLFKECFLKFLKTKTRILVTHQVQFLTKVDFLLVIKNGKVELRKMEREAPLAENYAPNDPFQDSINLESEFEEEIIRDSRTLRKYIKAAQKPILLSLVGLGLILCQILSSCTDFWVTFWTQNIETLNSLTAIYIYAILIISMIFIAFLRSSFYFKLAMSASKNLHKNILRNLLEAPISFFEKNPSGKILNRFSKDLGSVDEILPKALLEAIQIFLTILGVLTMVVISNHYMLIAVVILGFIFLKIRAWFVLVTKHVKHLEGKAKSPIFSHLNSSLQGLTTIRAFGAQEKLQNTFDSIQDLHTSVWFILITSISSFGLWLDLICLIFITTIIFSFIVLRNYIEIDPSFIGLAISQSLILTGMLQYGVRQSAEVVNQLTSVERLLQYNEIDKETPLATPPLENWPNQGFILFENVSLQYSKKPILKNLNFEIQAGHKVGIVGRTGAGKSSLISALFRLNTITGKIYIDGVDIQKIGLYNLRKKLTIIPQEPIIFTTTLRNNLDPFQEFSDQEIWSVLGELNLKSILTSLETPISKNLSSGQMQLICLARAMLRNNNILVLDEATANIDEKTDHIIQKIIRKKFASCTVLTIAHRLQTIMDSDRIIVMENGAIIEFDHPYLLLQNPQSVFFKMVLEMGSEMSGRLEDIALDAFLHKIQ